jgi:peptidoglycan/LPS O-acetylase OafA/YrhL
MATRPTGTSGVALRLAAAAQAAEAVGLAVAAVFSAVSTADGQSYQQASGIALTLMAFGGGAVLAAFAAGLYRARPWSRTPVVMTQLFVIISGLTLLDGHRPAWGVPALALAVGCLAGLFTPASVRALNRPPRPPVEPTPASRPPAKSPQAKSPQAKSQPAKRQPAK